MSSDFSSGFSGRCSWGQVLSCSSRERAGLPCLSRLLSVQSFSRVIIFSMSACKVLRDTEFLPTVSIFIFTYLLTSSGKKSTSIDTSVVSVKSSAPMSYKYAKSFFRFLRLPSKDLRLPATSGLATLFRAVCSSRQSFSCRTQRPCGNSRRPD